MSGPLAAALSWQGAGDGELIRDVERMMAAAPGAAGRRAAVLAASARTALGGTIETGSSGRSGGAAERVAATPDRRLWLVLDGRLDNREELRSALGADERLPATASDTALLLSCLERWGEGALERLEGPYAFVLIDTRGPRLLCARDPSTLHPLFFHHRPGRSIVVASEISQLLALPQVPRDPDDLIVSEFLVGRPHADPGRSFFRDLRRVPGGHVLIADERGLSVKRSWHPAQAAQRIWSSEEECFSAGRALFRGAVQRALAGDGSRVLLLSGGYDSAAVAGVLGEIRSSGGSCDITAVHVAFAGVSCDETAYVEETLRCFPLPFVRLDAAPLSLAEVAGAARDRACAPISSPIFLFPRVAAALAGDGSSAAVSGDGGDELFASAGVETDLVRRKSYLALGRLIWHENPLGISTAFRLRLLAGRLVRTWARTRRLSRAGGSLGLRPFPAALSQDAVDLLSRPHGIAEDAPPQVPSEVQREAWRRLVGGIDQDRGVESRAIDSRRSGLEYRCPFLDRRLMEWSLSAPFDARVDVRQFKALLVRSMRAYLPEAIVRRNRKTRYTEYWARCVGALGKSFEEEGLDGPDWPSAPYLDREGVRAHFKRLLAQPPQELPARGDDIGVVLAWRAIALDLWLRSLASTRPRDADRPAAAIRLSSQAVGPSSEAGSAAAPSFPGPDSGAPPAAGASSLGPSSAAGSDTGPPGIVAPGGGRR